MNHYSLVLRKANTKSDPKGAVQATTIAVEGVNRLSEPALALAPPPPVPQP